MSGHFDHYFTSQHTRGMTAGGSWEEEDGLEEEASSPSTHFIRQHPPSSASIREHPPASARTQGRSLAAENGNATAPTLFVISEEAHDDDGDDNEDVMMTDSIGDVIPAMSEAFEVALDAANEENFILKFETRPRRNLRRRRRRRHRERANGRPCWPRRRWRPKRPTRGTQPSRRPWGRWKPR